MCIGVPPPPPDARVAAVRRASTQPTTVPAPLSFRDGQLTREEVTPVSTPLGPGVVYVLLVMPEARWGGTAQLLPSSLSRATCPGAPRLQGQSSPEAPMLERPRRDTWAQRELRGAQRLSPPSGGLGSAVSEPSVVSRPSSECKRGGAARRSPVRS